jgi:hypothetical protein
MANGRGLEFLYVALGVGALVATWAQVPAYLGLGFWPAQVAFWKDVLTTPAGVFIAVDITLLVAAVMIWLFGECRRVGIAPMFGWGYLVGSLLIGVSCFVPLFLAHRERKLRGRTAENGKPAGSDWLAVGFMVTGSVLAMAYSFTHLPGPSP